MEIFTTYKGDISVRYIPRLLLLLVILIALLLIITSFNKSITSDDKEQDEYTQLDWYIDFEWFDRVWATDVVSREIRDKTGVHINFIVPGESGNITRDLSIIIATNNLPDLVTLDAEDIRIKEMISSGMVYSYDELAKKYSPKFNNYIDMEVYDHIKSPDGQHYYYPNYAITSSNFDKIKDNLNSSNGLIVRKDIFELLGKPDMTTPAGFLKALQDAKKLLPQTELGSLIPIGFNEMQPDLNSLNFQLKSMLGILRTDTLNSEYLQWINVFRKAYNMGLISSEIFIDNRADIHRRIKNAQYFALLFRFHDAEEALTQLNSITPSKMYIAVEGPSLSNSTDHQYYYDTDIDGWTATMISKNCKYPEKAFKLVTYMMSPEGQKTVVYGKEGTSFEIINGKNKLLPEVEVMKKTNRTLYNKIYAGNNHYWMFSNLYYQSVTWPLIGDSPLNQLTKFKRGKIKYQDKEQVFNINAGNHISKGLVYLDDLKWNDTILQLITSETEEEFNKVLKDYKEFREDLGLE